jgi:hypothetical protein
VIPYERDFPRRNKARKWPPLSDKALAAKIHLNTQFPAGNKKRRAGNDWN